MAGEGRRRILGDLDQSEVGELMQRKSQQGGFTLIELMVSLVILSIAIAAAFGIAFSILNGLRDGKRTADVEQRVRMAMDFLTGTIRSSSPGVTTAALQDVAECQLSGAMTVTNSATGPDEITLIHGRGGVVGFLTAALTEVSDEISVNADDPDFRGTLFFEDDDYVVVTNGANGHLFQVKVKSRPVNQAEVDSGVVPWVLELVDAPGGAATSVTGLCGSNAAKPSGAITEPFLTGTKQYEIGAVVVRAQISRIHVQDFGGTPYLVVGDIDGSDPTDVEPLAEGIEDLQITIGVDDGNGGGTANDGDIFVKGAALDDDELYYNFDGDTDPPAIEVTPWAAMQITITARTVGEIQSGGISTRPAAGDRPAGTEDNFRRRTLSSVVELRNVN